MRRGDVMLLAALVVVDCAPLEDVPAGACGNGVVETGEDCDLFVAHGMHCEPPGDQARQCRYTCADPESESACPPGWRCHPSEHVCHHGTGEFDQASAPEEPLIQWAVGDIDGDGHADLVGTEDQATVVRYGDGGGAFVTRGQRSEPSLYAGHVAFGDLDVDSRLDLVVPVLGGLGVLKGSPDREQIVDPAAYAPFHIDGPSDGWLVPIRAYGVGGGQAVAWLRYLAFAGEVQVSCVPIPKAEPWRPIAVPGQPLTKLGTRIPVADVDDDGVDELALAFDGASSAFVISSGANVFAPAGDGEMERKSTIELAGRTVALPSGSDSAARFADVDGDGTMDLLIHVSDGVAVAHGTGTGVFDPPTLDSRFDAVGWPLAAADLNGDVAADYVGEDGVYLTDGSKAVLAKAADAKWRDAEIGDFDHNGFPDVAAAEDGELRFRMGPDFKREFHPGVKASLLRKGDFDNDGIDDVAFVARGDPSDTIEIAWGWTESGPSPQFVAKLPRIAHLEAGLFSPAPGEPSDARSDLVVSLVGTSNQPVAFLFGAEDRTLSAPLALEENNTADRPIDVFEGHFTRPDGDRSLVAFGKTEAGAIRPWLVAPGSDGRFARPTVAGFNVGQATWALGDVDGDGLDDLVGVGPDGGTVLRARETPIGTTLDSSSFDLAAAPRAIQLADLDGDHRADLLVSTGGEARIYWAQAAEPAFDPADNTFLDSDANAFAVLDTDGDGRPDVVTVDASSVWMFSISPAHAASGAKIRGTAGGEDVRAADVNGDGLSDIVVKTAAERFEVLIARSHLDAETR